MAWSSHHARISASRVGWSGTGESGLNMREVSVVRGSTAACDECLESQVALSRPSYGPDLSAVSAWLVTPRSRRGRVRRSGGAPTPPGRSRAGKRGVVSWYSGSHGFLRVAASFLWRDCCEEVTH